MHRFGFALLVLAEEVETAARVTGPTDTEGSEGEPRLDPLIGTVRVGFRRKVGTRIDEDRGPDALREQIARDVQVARSRL